MTAAPSLRDAIEDRILTGDLPPGARLDEVSLAHDFGVSRTPVRQALFQLAATGLVQQIPRRGAFVADTGPLQLQEMFEVMAELEALCARNAARRATQTDVAELEGLHETCRSAAQTGDGDTYYYANEAFHDAIRRISGNTYLHQDVTRLQKRLQAYRRLQLRARSRIGASLQEHDAILTAIRDGQPEAAAAAMRAHVAVQGERFADLVRHHAAAGVSPSPAGA